jgi:hypothetical protein
MEKGAGLTEHGKIHEESSRTGTFKAKNPD